jgi:uncharacterized protein YjbI with pentapeptide repeats
MEGKAMTEKTNNTAPAQTTTTAPDVPKWGDPLDAIPLERRQHLLELAAQQRAWVASALEGQRDLAKSVFHRVDLNGQEVFLLAAVALAGPEAAWADIEAAADRLRSAQRDALGMWVVIPDLHLEGAELGWAQLERANLSGAHLERATLSYAQLERANLGYAYLEHATLSYAHLAGASLSYAHLAGASLSYAHLEGASLWGAHLETLYSQPLR